MENEKIIATSPADVSAGCRALACYQLRVSSAFDGVTRDETGHPRRYLLERRIPMSFPNGPTAANANTGSSVSGRTDAPGSLPSLNLQSEISNVIVELEQHAIEFHLKLTGSEIKLDELPGTPIAGHVGRAIYNLALINRVLTLFQKLHQFI